MAQRHSHLGSAAPHRRTAPASSTLTQTAREQAILIPDDDEEDLLQFNVIASLHPPPVPPPPTTTKKRRRAPAAQHSPYPQAPQQPPLPLRPPVRTPPTLLWSEQYAPCSVSELAVQPAKIAALTAWLQQACHGTEPPHSGTLLLCGPPGCAKSTTLHLLAAQEGITLLPYHNATRWEGGLYHTASPPHQEALLSPFLQFVSQSPHQSPLPLQTGSPSKVVLLVEDVPHVYSSAQRSQFGVALMDQVRGALTGDRYPLILVSTEEGGVLSPLRQAVPPTFESSPGVTRLEMRPIPQRAMLKALQRVATLSGTGTAQVGGIVAEGRGDLRAAIQRLQWTSLRRTPLQEGEGATDRSLTVFHAVGKVLYNKRLLPNGDESPLGSSSLRALYAQSQSQSPQRQGRVLSVAQAAWRPPVKSRVQDIVDHYLYAESELFTLFLQENALSFVSSSGQQQEDVTPIQANLTDYLSLTDILQSGKGGLFGAQREAAVWVAIMGLQYSNTLDTPRGKDTSKFRKSSWPLMLRKLRQNKDLLDLLLRSVLQRDAILQPAEPLTASPPQQQSLRRGATEFVPFLSLLRRVYPLPSSVAGFVQLINNYSLRASWSALPVRTLEQSDALSSEELNEVDTLESEKVASERQDTAQDLYSRVHSELQAMFIATANKSNPIQLGTIEFDAIEDPDV